METSSASRSVFSGVLGEPKVTCTARLIIEEVANVRSTLQVVAVADSKSVLISASF